MNILEEFAMLKLEAFAERLNHTERNILGAFASDYLGEKVVILVTRMAEEGELDVFCGYYMNQAIFLSLCPDKPIILLDQKTVRERLMNLKKHGVHCDQSEEALANWPS